jgi:hypothetical protein
MPDRIIRDRSRSSPTLQLLSDAAERAWWRLTVAVDDFGRFDADPEVLLARLFERKPKGWTIAKMSAVVEEWTSGEDPLVHLYQVADDCGNLPQPAATRGNLPQPGNTRVLGHIVHFKSYQRGRDSRPKFPDPPCQKAPPNATSPQLAASCRNSRLARAGVREARGERREARADGCGERPPEAASPPSTPDSGPGALDPELHKILADCPHLALVSNGKSAAFWDQVLASCEPYGVCDAAWIGLRLRNWNQWFAGHKDRQSKKRETLESRLMGWLVKDLESLSRKAR